MGFNIAGIVVNKNYDNKIDELGKSLRLNLTFEKEISFDEASSNWKDERVCDIYFAEYGTLLFLDMERCLDDYSIDSQNVLTFAVSEASMAFNLKYYEGTLLHRSIMEIDGNIMRQKGVPLSEEANASDTSDLIFTKIGNVLGQSFWDIDFQAKAFRYKI